MAIKDSNIQVTLVLTRDEVTVIDQIAKGQQMSRSKTLAAMVRRQIQKRVVETAKKAEG